MDDNAVRTFWDQVRTELNRTPLEPEVEPVTPELDSLVGSSKVTMTGLGGVRICASYSVPRLSRPGPMPAVMFTPGYGGGTAWTNVIGLAHDQGYCVLGLYPRGQGLSTEHWSMPEGLTKLTMGLDAPANQYYRLGYADCLRGIDFLCSREEVDSSRIGVLGMSQGGGLTLATAALDERVRVAVAHEPFLCNYPVAVESATTGPYLELIDLFRRQPEMKQSALETLAWIDPVNLARWIQCPTLVTVGLADTTCPPETIRPVYDRISPMKCLVEMPGRGHGWYYEYRALDHMWLKLHL